MGTSLRSPPLTRKFSTDTIPYSICTPDCLDELLETIFRLQYSNHEAESATALANNISAPAQELEGGSSTLRYITRANCRSFRASSYRTHGRMIAHRAWTKDQIKLVSPNTMQARGRRGDMDKVGRHSCPSAGEELERRRRFRHSFGIVFFGCAFSRCSLFRVPFLVGSLALVWSGQQFIRTNNTLAG